jgi:hypothetical protein
MTEIFKDGQESSQAVLVDALEGIRGKGQSVLNDLEAARVEILLRLEQGLSALNARQQRANRLVSSNVIGKFVVSDFFSVDQANTTATVRADAQSATLKERKQPSEGIVRSTKFSSSGGTVQQFGDMYRVGMTDGGIPTGVFDLEFVTPTTLNLVVFDIVTFPSNPAITVQASENGVSYTDALNISRNGYRVNAWMPKNAVKFLRIAITPNQPDNIGGSSFTFGVTNFHAESVAFHLRSDLVMRPITIQPRSFKLRFMATEDEHLNYFMSFDNQAYFEVVPGREIQVPGAVEVNQPLVTLEESGKLQHTLPDSVYLPTLKITDINDLPVRIAPDLAPAAKPINNFYITVNGTDLHHVPFYPALHQGLTYNVKYVSGPEELKVWLRVRLSTDSQYETPIFCGAHLEEV